MRPPRPAAVSVAAVPIATTPTAAVLLAAVLLVACLLVGGVAAADPVRPAAGAGCDRATTVIVLDVGHTPQATGATGARGSREYDLNRALAEVVRGRLVAAGFRRTEVLLSEGVGRPQLLARPARAAALGASLFLSLHHDDVQDAFARRWTVAGKRQRRSDHARGFSLFVSGPSPRFAESRRFAEDLADALIGLGRRPTLHHAEPIAGENRPLLDPARGLYRFDDLLVLKDNPAVAVLLESAVVAQPDDEAAAATPAFRAGTAEAVVAAASRWCAGD
jgi:N-acetylmuramoyl-L-alanine amidase